MRIFKQRFLIITMVSTAIAAGCGTLAGYLLGLALTLRHTETRLDQPYADRIFKDAETTAAEARDELCQSKCISLSPVLRPGNRMASQAGFSIGAPEGCRAHPRWQNRTARQRWTAW